jgi:hypothetical protein
MFTSNRKWFLINPVGITGFSMCPSMFIIEFNENFINRKSSMKRKRFFFCIISEKKIGPPNSFKYTRKNLTSSCPQHTEGGRGKLNSSTEYFKIKWCKNKPLRICVQIPHRKISENYLFLLTPCFVCWHLNKTGHINTIAWKLCNFNTQRKTPNHTEIVSKLTQSFWVHTKFYERRRKISFVFLIQQK